MYDVAIVGCGVIGAATAYELSRRECSVVVLEAHNDVADGTTKANSAILHAGYDPEPGTRMAELNVRGVELAKQICERLHVPRVQCGSLVLALRDEDLPHIQHLYENGVANGVPGIELLDAEQTKAKEPQVADTVKGALWAPSAAIVSPWDYTLCMIEVAVRNGCELLRSCKVAGIERREDAEGPWFALETPAGKIEARCVVNAAGLGAEEIHNMVAAPTFHITPTRGEYYLLDKSEGTRANTVVFQCPDEKGKGVLVAPTFAGNLIVGPNAEPVEGDDTATTAAGLAFVAEQARKSIPTFDLRENIRNFAGVRANVDTGDFVIGEPEDALGFVDLAGMKSPGLSCAPSIAEEAVKLLEARGVVGAEKADFDDSCYPRYNLQGMTADERAALVAKRPDYGRVICRCETITEGQIVDALHSPVPATTIDGVKRRTSAGFGRCQGGFCGPRVLELICRELGMDPTDVLKDKEGTWVLDSETKQGGRHAGDDAAPKGGE